MRKRLFSLVLVFALILLSANLFAEGYREPYHLVILATSDMHGNVWGYSYEDNAETNNNGMARVYEYVTEMREQFPDLLLIDGGDTIQGTIMTDDLANKSPWSEHPIISAMNYMGYDAMTLGNHEFNWGIPRMLMITGQADFPVLAQNVFIQGETVPVGGGWIIKDVKGIKVAIIGVDTPNIPRWDGGKPLIDESVYEAGYEAVRRAIEEIGDQADVIVVSSHMGLEPEYDTVNGTDSAQKMLDMNPEIDVLQVAHLHTAVAEKQGDVVIGGARNLGRDVVRFDLYFDKDKNLIDSTVEVVDMKDYEPSQALRDLPIVKEYHEKTIAYVNDNVIGETTAKFQPENEIKGIPEGKLRDTAVMDLINNVQLKYADADVSAAALFKDTSDLPEGSINYGNIFDIYKYDNTLMRVEVTGKELKDYMEWAAQCWAQWEDGDISIAFNASIPGYRHDFFQGVDYEVDLSQPAGSRIKNVMFNGAPLEDDQTLKLAVNNYRYSSALKAENIVRGEKEWESPNSIRDMLVEYISENGPIEPTVDNNWKIVGVDLNLEDPRRAEIIGWINDGKLSSPYNDSYNLKDYEAIKSEATSK